MTAETTESTGPDASAVGPEAFEEALGRAYRFLGHRDRTVAEVRRHLERQALADPLIEACVTELLEQRYLDDDRFALRFTEDRRNLDGWGADRIRRRLLELGVDAARAERAVSGRDAESELDAAIAVLHQRVRVPPTDQRGRNRALGLLVRRGYDLELAHDAIRRFSREPD